MRTQWKGSGSQFQRISRIRLEKGSLWGHKKTGSGYPWSSIVLAERVDSVCRKEQCVFLKGTRLMQIVNKYIQM
ncbi:hypothetical protein CEXT_534741 [Caerostris extrusa]|uniref:Uncharacterized protein n=1 Tax=Caerostris extrusa TaxID=172846 RepID=A0AAV4WSW4_CAEEX|nr:hypothetical protein CEXT_534741 [Caerostris extrusa]